MIGEGRIPSTNGASHNHHIGVEKTDFHKIAIFFRIHSSFHHILSLGIKMLPQRLIWACKEKYQLHCHFTIFSPFSPFNDDAGSQVYLGDLRSWDLKFIRLPIKHEEKVYLRMNHHQYNAFYGQIQKIYLQESLLSWCTSSSLPLLLLWRSISAKLFLLSFQAWKWSIKKHFANESKTVDTFI